MVEKVKRYVKSLKSILGWAAT